jgi:hypothetical protein
MAEDRPGENQAETKAQEWVAEHTVEEAETLGAPEL